MTEELLEVYRHSLAHILAKAVIEMFGKDNVQYAIGPQIADGCYYDFTLPRPITEDDYKTIEDKMAEIIKRKEDWTRKEISRAEALELFKDQKYKTELIEDLPEELTRSNPLPALTGEETAAAILCREFISTHFRTSSS